METYFHNDPRINQWIDQITEKIFTVSLLKGVDAEKEFSSGCQIVSKLTNLLQAISIIPPEYLEDVVQQLVEQQLPDIKIVNNFPSFEAIKKSMLTEGINSAAKLKEEISEPKTAIPDQTHDIFLEETIISLNQDTSFQINLEAKTEGSSPNGQAEQLIEQDHQILLDEVNYQPLETIPDQAVLSSNIISLDIKNEDKNPSEEDILTTEITQNNDVEKDQSYIENGSEENNNLPEGKERLERILLQIYPGRSVKWNIKVADQPVYAKIEDLLICLYDPNNPCNIKKMNRQGWKVFICSNEDLMFPRRVERGIRQILRNSKQKLPTI